jgi:hypothetical protein
MRRRAAPDNCREGVPGRPLLAAGAILHPARIQTMRCAGLEDPPDDAAAARLAFARLKDPQVVGVLI